MVGLLVLFKESKLTKEQKQIMIQLKKLLESSINKIHIIEKGSDKRRIKRKGGKCGKKD